MRYIIHPDHLTDAFHRRHKEVRAQRPVRASRLFRVRGDACRPVTESRLPAILNLHERIKNKLFLDRTRKDSNFKRPHIYSTLFQIEKCWLETR